MQASVIETTGVKRLRLEGSVAATEAAGFAEFLDQLYVEEGAGLIWDLSALDEDIDGDGAAVLVEGFARMLVGGTQVILLKPPERVLGLLRTVGVGRVVAVADDDKEALVQFFKSLDKRYDDAFFQLLISEGYITADQLEEAHQEYARRGGAAPIDEIMLEMGLLNVEDILRVLAKRKTFLGEILVDAGLITKGTLVQILDVQKERGGKLGDLLKEIGAVSDRDIYEALAIQYWRKTEMASDAEIEITVVDRVNFLSSDDYLIVRESEEALIERGGEVVPTLLQHVRREDLSTRPRIARILGEIRDGRALPVLAELLEAPDSALRDEAYWALVKTSRQELAVTATWRWGRWVAKNAEAIPEATPFEALAPEDWQRTFADVCEGQRSLEDFSIEYEAGKEAWEGGKVNLLIEGAGRVLLKRSCRGDITLTSTSVSGQRVRELLGALYDNKVWNVKTKRSFGDLNEPRHVFTFRCGASQRLSVFYWATEMYGNLSLMNIENAAKVVLRYLSL